MSLAQLIAEEARLKILQLLRATGDKPVNNAVMQSALDSMGVRLSSDQVRQELKWLADARCITTIEVGPLVVAELLERGLDVAKGRAEIPGILRYVPGTGL